MPITRPFRTLAAACLVVITLLGVSPRPAAALEPPRPLPDHRPAFVTETDVRPWTDCLWASAAMLLDKWTNGDVRVTHQRLRRLSGDASGGSSFEEMRVAFRRLGFQVQLDANGDSTLTWRALLARLKGGAGAVVLGDYGDLPRWYGRWDDRFWNGKSKTDNHAIYVERYDARHGRVWAMDPLARGAWKGEWMSTWALYRFAWFRGGHVQAITTPTAREAPFRGVTLASPEVGVSSAAITATWRVRAARRWRFQGADVKVSMARAADPLLAAARSVTLGPRITRDPAPPRPVASVTDRVLRAVAPLPKGEGAYSATLAVIDRRFGKRVATSEAVLVFVPGPRHASLRPQPGDRSVVTGATTRVTLQVVNDGTVSWADADRANIDSHAAAARTTRVVATWILLDQAVAIDAAAPGLVDLGRAPLGAGGVVRLQADLAAPASPGRWALVVDVTDAVDGSFAASGSSPAVMVFEVVARDPADSVE
jgi:hypothetical protein